MNQIGFFVWNQAYQPHKEKNQWTGTKKDWFLFFFKFCDSFNDLDIESDTQT